MAAYKRGGTPFKIEENKFVGVPEVSKRQLQQENKKLKELVQTMTKRVTMPGVPAPQPPTSSPVAPALSTLFADASTKRGDAWRDLYFRAQSLHLEALKLAALDAQSPILDGGVIDALAARR